MGFSTTHLIIFLVIIILVFGTKKLKNIGADLGNAIKGFKDGMKDGAAPEPTPAPPTPLVHSAQADPNKSSTIEVEVQRKS